MLTGCGDARTLKEGMFHSFELVWQTAQNGRLQSCVRGPKRFAQHVREYNSPISANVVSENSLVVKEERKRKIDDGAARYSLASEGVFF